MPIVIENGISIGSGITIGAGGAGPGPSGTNNVVGYTEMPPPVTASWNADKARFGY